MDILKAATDWARSEVFSTPFFILFGIVFVAISIGLWQLGKTDLARAYIIPILVAGVLLIIIGSGLLYTNITRISSFEADYKKNATAFVEAEMVRVEGTLNEYNTVFKVIPLMIIAAALLVLFLNTPTWRAIGITSIAMLIVILFIDGMAHARIADYKEQLVLAERQE